MEFDRAYLRAMLREGAGETTVVGLRVMWGTIGEMSERLGFLHPGATVGALFEKLFGPLVYIHVSRRDKVAQAISLLKAEQSGLWHVDADGSDRQRTVPSAPVHYDAGRISELMAELEGDDAGWNEFFARHGIEPVRVEYETLAACAHGEVRKILLALGLPPGLAGGLAVQTSKMADDESTAWADRFHREQELGTRGRPPGMTP
jgi:LPS sulfotransferase NodH